MQVEVEATAQAQQVGVVGEYEWLQLEQAVLSLATPAQLPLQVGPFNRKVSADMGRWDPPTLAVSATFR